MFERKKLSENFLIAWHEKSKKAEIYVESSENPMEVFKYYISDDYIQSKDILYDTLEAAENRFYSVKEIDRVPLIQKYKCDRISLDVFVKIMDFGRVGKSCPEFQDTKCGILRPVRELDWAVGMAEKAAISAEKKDFIRENFICNIL